MKLYIGADHNGYELKQKLTEYLRGRGHEVIDEGNQQLDPADDFPLYAHELVAAMQSDSDPEARGILICGSGQGMVMAANRYKGVRASLVWNESSAKDARSDDDSNILCMAAKELPNFDDVIKITDVWLSTPFLGEERFVRRIKQIDEVA